MQLVTKPIWMAITQNQRFVIYAINMQYHSITIVIFHFVHTYITGNKIWNN